MIRRWWWKGKLESESDDELDELEQQLYSKYAYEGLESMHFEDDEELEKLQAQIFAEQGYEGLDAMWS